MPIPKILHQVWHVFPNGSEHPPKKYQEYSKRWKDLHPDWSFYTWTKESSEKLVREEFPHLYQTYLAYPQEIQRVDAIRLMILAKFGGVYSDMDLYPLCNFNYLLCNDVLLVKDPIPINGINNGLMGAVPNHPLFVKLCQNLPKSAKIPCTMAKAGPWYLTVNYLSSEKKGVKVLSLKEGEQVFRHTFSALWTPVGQAKQWLDPERRKELDLSKAPKWLRPFLK